MQLLLAEDEQALSNALVTILEHSGYRVQAVLDGPGALAALTERSFDAAILDIMMPGMDGIEVVRRARAHGIQVPIIMLTAKSEVEDKVCGLDAGANDYLTKPFSAKELMARIRALTRPVTAAGDALVVGTARLDRSARTLAGPSGVEHLSNREFELLEQLMARPGTKIATERLLLAVWGDDAPEDASVVWVYISYLRKKLAACGTDVRIRAARGQGYTIEVAGDGAR